MDGILLPVKGKTAENLKRTLERPAPDRNYSKEEEEKVLKIWQKNKEIRSNLKKEDRL